MTSYYEGILKMPGVSGVANKASYKRPIKRMTDGDVDVQAPPLATGAAAAPAAAAEAAPPEAAGAAEQPPAEKAASPVKDRPAKGGKGTKSKG